MTVGTSTSAVCTACGQLLARHRRVVDVQARVEQFAHARFDDVGQLAGDDDEGFLCGHWRQSNEVRTLL